MPVGRSPPPVPQARTRVGLAIPEVQEQNCQACVDADNMQMVACDVCELWYHYTCVGVNSSIESSIVPWQCPKCAQKKPPSNASVRASSKSSSRRRKAEIELRILEEKRQLQAQRAAEQAKADKEYLDQKLLLLQQQDENTDDEKFDDEELDNTDRTNEWATSATNMQVHLADVHANAQPEEMSASVGQPKLLSQSDLPARTAVDNRKFTLEDISEHSDNNLQQAVTSHTTRQGIPQYRPTQPPTVPAIVSATTAPAEIHGPTHVNISAMNDPNANRRNNMNTGIHNNRYAALNVDAIYPAPLANESSARNNPVTSHAGFSASNVPRAGTRADISYTLDDSAGYVPQQLTRNQIAARQGSSKDLHTFSGKPEEWPLFISLFERSTIVCNFSEEENLMRLQKCLKGKALDAVSSRLILPSGVTQVIATLKQLFGRPELIIHNLLQKVRNEPMPKMEKLDTIVSYSLAVQNLCATMESCSLTAHLNNPILQQELTEKLPAQLRLSWATHQRSSVNSNLSTFSSWLAEIAQAASSVSYPDSSANRAHVHAHSDAKQQSPSTSNLQSSFNKSVPTEKGKCAVCLDDHHVADCSKFRSLELNARWDTIKTKKLCRRCLGRHIALRCKSKSVCGKNNCVYKHHQLLHNDFAHRTVTVVAPVSNTTPTTTACNNTHQQQKQSVLFRIVPVVLYGKEKSIHTYAFFDEGSSVTLLEDSIADELQLHGVYESLCLKWTSEQVRLEPESRSVNLEISGLDKERQRYRMRNVRTVKSLGLPEQSLSMEILGEKFSHLREIPLALYSKVRPQLLIGNDHAKLGLPLLIKEGSWSEPIAMKTRLGWTVHGCLQDRKQPSEFNVVHYNFHACECNLDDALHKMVKEFFDTENAGISVPLTIESDEDIRARKIMESTTTSSGNRYTTGLLWKYDNIDLPDSYAMAKRRLICLEKKMSLDPVLNTNLRQQLTDYIAKGYARRLSQEELSQHSPRSWYLPVFAVKNPNKPTKIRLVWDAAAKVNGFSLNSVLLKGPDQLASLQTVLYGFREKRIAICGDIREMFHQVGIRAEDQNSQRFLWRDNDQQEPDVYGMQVMTFGATCSPSSAQYIKNKNALDFVHKYPRAVMAITDRHYVDDLLDSLDTEEEAIQLAQTVRLIHRKAGFEIRNWVSNSPAVVAAMGESSETGKELKLCVDGGAEKVLGMLWCTLTDSFTFKVNYDRLDIAIVKRTRKPTKREVLRTLMSIFDPLGLLAHFLVYVKVLLQEVWRSSIGWDECLADDQNDKWNIWYEMLPNVSKVRVPRCYSFKISPGPHVNTQLHIFVDASENAYAAVAYLRIFDGKQVQLALVGAKTKVAPIKPMSIPRLELQAATLGSRFAKTISNSHSLKIDQRIFWSDSRTVLSWLKSDQRKYRQFVAFRVGEILDITNIAEWRWIPTKLNVADDATKWQKVPEFTHESRWYSGPEFLKFTDDKWPQTPTNMPVVTEDLRIHSVSANIELPITPDPARFSKWQRLLRAQARILRCVSIFACRVRKTEAISAPLDSEELQNAENQLIRRAQHEHYGDEIIMLQRSSNKSMAKSSSIIAYSPRLDDDGLLRIRGRIDEMTGVPDSVKQPIILPKDHLITRLVVNDYHVMYNHQNTETVINELRQLYAIPRIRQVLKSVRRNCQVCKNKRAKPQPPEMAMLPYARLAAFTRPFTYVGVDYFGPMTVVIGRRTEKRWGVLFTCLTIRAVHLEVAHSLTTDSCILCIRSFMARRGTPRYLYCDNGTNFHGADNELKKAYSAISMDGLQEAFTTTQTQWRFNPPASPHMGGCWERLVGSVKRTLEKIMPQRNPTDELLRAMLTEAENIVNSRPLTFVSIDLDDPSALTPNHFLLGTSNGSKPPGEFSDSDLILRKNWRKSQQFTNMFWKKWVAAYLPTLTRRSKWFQPVKPIAIDDIVIIVDENLPRNSWPLGKVVSVKIAKDGCVRSATVFTSNGIYTRPAAKLAVLDIRTKENSKPTA